MLMAGEQNPPRPPIQHSVGSAGTEPTIAYYRMKSLADVTA